MADMEFTEDMAPEGFKQMVEGLATGGIRNLCTDAKRCGLGNLCEHAQDRGVSCNLVAAWTTHKQGDCANYFPRTELGSKGDIPRNYNRKGRSRHNMHAPDRNTERARILGPGGQPLQPPDLMVSRHIKDGRNIKGDD